MKADAFWRVLKRYHDVRRLWIGETVAVFGSNLFSIALMWYVFARTGSGLATGLVAVAQFIPQVALGPWFGVLADRYNRQRIMAGSNIASGVSAGVLALAVAMHVAAIWPVYAATVAMGIASTLYNPARAAIFPDIVRQDDLLTTHALFHSSRQMARVAGAAVGGVVVATVGAASAMTVDGVTFLVAAAFVLGMRSVRPPARTADAEDSPQGLESLRIAWRWLKERPVLLVMSAIAMVSNIALGPSNVLPPMLIRNSFHASAAALGTFDAAIGAGVIAGGILIGMLTIDRVGLSMALALGLEALALLIIALSPNPLWADAGNLLLGMGLVTANAPGETMAQTIVPPELLGRVSALSGMMASFAIPLTFGGVGLVGDAIGPHATFGLAAGLMGTTVAAAFLVPGIRSYRLGEHRVRQEETDSGTALPPLP